MNVSPGNGQLQFANKLPMFNGQLSFVIQDDKARPEGVEPPTYGFEVLERRVPQVAETTRNPLLF